MNKNILRLLTLTLALFVICTQFQSKAQAQAAGEPLPEFKGDWVLDTFNGKKPDNVMTASFLNDQTVVFTIIDGETSEKTNVKYKATKDGKVTFYPEPDENPKGDSGKWQVKDKKLHIKLDSGDTLVWARPE